MRRSSHRTVSFRVEPNRGHRVFRPSFYGPALFPRRPAWPPCVDSMREAPSVRCLNELAFTPRASMVRPLMRARDDACPHTLSRDETRRSLLRLLLRPVLRSLLRANWRDGAKRLTRSRMFTPRGVHFSPYSGEMHGRINFWDLGEKNKTKKHCMLLSAT